MVSAKQYVANYYGDKEKAIKVLEQGIKMYEASPRKHTPKMAKRLEQYKRLLDEINAL